MRRWYGCSHELASTTDGYHCGSVQIMGCFMQVASVAQATIMTARIMANNKCVLLSGLVTRTRWVLQTPTHTWDLSVGLVSLSSGASGVLY